MERLTKQWGKDNCNCVPVKLDYGELLDLDERNFDELDKIVRKLAMYEDLEDQGLLLKLPCKIGENVYVLDKISCSECNYSRYYCSIATPKCPSNVITKRFEYWMIEEIGKTAFLSKEEAENKSTE